MPLAPEARVLLATVRDEPERLLRALAAGPEWPRLVALAEKEKATPVLRRRLRASADARGLVPPDPLRALDRLAVAHELRLHELERHLGRLLEGYANAGIRPVLLKGAALRRTVYAGVVDRPMGDVDLLVEEARSDRAWAIASELGWRRREGLAPPAAYAGHHHLPPLDDTSGLALGLEIHTALFPSHAAFRLSADEIRREAASAPGEPALVPCPEHLLLHTALHFTWSHLCAFGAWKTFRDVHALTTAGAMDWEQVSVLAHRTQGGAGLYWTLRLAREWAGVPVPDEPLRALRPRMGARVEALLRRHFALRAFTLEGTPLPLRVERCLWEMAMRPRSEGHGVSRPWCRAASWRGGARARERAARDRDAAAGPAGRAVAAARHLARALKGA